jgi:transcriptional regulator with GAF, ATPase, and Fis domain
MSDVLAQTPLPPRSGPAHGLPAVERLVGNSEWVRQMRDDILRVAPHPANVLITGPTGTGKELIAQAIHAYSPRGDRPLVTVDCAAVGGTLFASQMFGHVKGAFTGAVHDTLGFLRAADGGTVFLDEVGELIPSAQVKMLKFLDDGTLRRLAASASLQVKARVIAATNRDLEEEVRTGRFRLDLFHRLGVVTLRLPPLRERREDIPILARHYLEQFTRERHGGAITWGDDAMEVLTAYDWPGNVRELANLTERLVLLSAQGGEIRAGDLPAGMSRRPKLVQFDPSRSEVQVELPPHGVNFDAVEKAVLEAALKMAKGNVTRAAALLGMGRGGLRYRLERLQITVGVSRRRGRPMGRRRPRAA